MQKRSRITSLFSAVRYDEVLVLQSTPMMGVAFAIGTIAPAKIGQAALFAMASGLLLAHIFTYNDWAAIKQNSSATRHSSPTENIAPLHLLLFSALLFLGSMSILACVQPRTALIAAMIAAVGLLYSHPRLNAKSRPIFSSVAHFAGGLMHFLLGYCLFLEIDQRGLSVAVFFALTFTAGHLNHEVRDYHSDHAGGLRTNAVAFGERRAFLSGLIVFTIAYAWLLGLAWFQAVPRILALLPIIIYPVHLFWSMRVLRENLHSSSMSRFQMQYRGLYLVMGVAILVALFVA